SGVTRAPSLSGDWVECEEQMLPSRPLEDSRPPLARRPPRPRADGDGARRPGSWVTLVILEGARAQGIPLYGRETPGTRSAMRRLENCWRAAIVMRLPSRERPKDSAT